MKPDARTKQPATKDLREGSIMYRSPSTHVAEHNDNKFRSEIRRQLTYCRRPAEALLTYILRYTDLRGTSEYSAIELEELQSNEWTNTDLIDIWLDEYRMTIANETRCAHERAGD